MQLRCKRRLYSVKSAAGWLADGGRRAAYGCATTFLHTLGASAGRGMCDRRCYPFTLHLAVVCLQGRIALRAVLPRKAKTTKECYDERSFGFSAFDNPDGANAMVGTLQSLQKQQLIQLADAAVVVRKPDGKAKVRLNSLVGAGALVACWGMLIGLLFFLLHALAGVGHRRDQRRDCGQVERRGH